MGGNPGSHAPRSDLDLLHPAEHPVGDVAEVRFVVLHRFVMAAFPHRPHLVQVVEIEFDHAVERRDVDQIVLHEIGHDAAQGLCTISCDWDHSISSIGTT